MQESEYKTPYLKNVRDEYPSIVRRLWKQNRVIILDVRTPQEYYDHHIPGAILAPLDYIDYLKEMFHGKHVAVVCEHSNRSTFVTRSKPELFHFAYNVLGGMEMWMNLGYEVVRGMDENGELWIKHLKEKGLIEDEVPS